MSTGKRVLPVVAVTGSSIIVGCGGNSGGSCGSYGSYGSYGSFGVADPGHAHRAAPAGSVHAAPTKQQYYPGCSAPPSLGADGIYEGTLTDQATHRVTPIVAIIADNGDGHMSGQDGTYYRLTVATSGSNVSGDFSGYSHGASFPNGNETSAGTLSAQITSAGLTGTLTDQTGNVEALALTFDNTYTLGSALPTLTGTWNYSVSGFSLNVMVNPDGTFSALDSDGCSYSGSFTLIDPSFNAYSENYTRACNGDRLVFNGLASYFPPAGNSGAEIKILADDAAGDYLAADLK